MLHQVIRFLGAGRSAIVFLVRTQLGEVARKVFVSSTLADLIHIVFFGAPNPYRWCENAIKTAFYRRRILKKLLRFWFGNELTISNAISTGYDTNHKAYYLDTEFVEGRKAALATPFDKSFPVEFETLKVLMRKLDRCLAQAGFAGARWQAGYGQPCAYANFLMVKECGFIYWVWIDPESGVPAIAASNPVAQFGYYLPELIKRKKPLFDNIDFDRLSDYLISIHNDLWSIFNKEEIKELFEDLYSLKHHELAWRSRTRLENALAYHSKRIKMPQESIFYYSNHPKAWRREMIALGLEEGWKLVKAKAPELIRKVSRKLNPFPYLKALLPSKRRELADKFVETGVDDWAERGRFAEDKVANAARAALISLDLSKDPYLCDFGAHLTIWPVGKILSLAMAPLLFLEAFDSQEKLVIGALIVWGDSLARFGYTLIRGITDLLRGGNFPYLALVFSPIKMVGYFSYPFQMIFSAPGKHASEFLIYLLCSQLSDKVPIYGGECSGVEYRLNRLGWSLIKAPASWKLILGYSIATLPILLVMYLAAWPLPWVSLAGILLASTLGLWSWLVINRYT